MMDEIEKDIEWRRRKIEFKIDKLEESYEGEFEYCPAMEKGKEVLGIYDDVVSVKLLSDNTRIGEIANDIKPGVEITTGYRACGDERKAISEAQRLTRLFLEEGQTEPLDAFHSIVRSIDAGTYPSVATLRWLSGRLRKYMDNQGRYSLDECFGGGRRLFEARTNEQSRDLATAMASSFVGLYKLRPGIAYNIIATYLGGHDGMSEKTIRNWLSKEPWKSRFKSDVKYFQAMDDDRKRRSLESLPAHIEYDPEGHIVTAAKKLLAELPPPKKNFFER